MRRCIPRSTMTSKKAGRNIFSSLQRIGEILSFTLYTTSILRFLLHNSLKKFPSSAIASYTSFLTNPLKAAGTILCSSTWQQCVFSQPCNLVPFAVINLTRLATNPSGNFTPLRHLQNLTLFSLFNT
jgi:hypothetical protein